MPAVHSTRIRLPRRLKPSHIRTMITDMRAQPQRFTLICNDSRFDVSAHELHLLNDQGILPPQIVRYLRENHVLN